ncbi:MAG: thermonuclease family protein [Candidatus Omnitrophota bacterium]
MKKLIRIFRALSLSACVALPLMICGCSSSDPGRLEQVKVKRVIDGDTVELSDGRMARYIGIDCPELKKKTSSGWVEVHQPFAAEAKTANEELISKGPVVFEFDSCKWDKYNRLLVYCYVLIDGRKVFVQSELLNRGLAYLYTFPPNVKYTDILVESLKEAKDHKRGVWSLDLDIDAKDAKRFLGQRKSAKGKVESVFSTPKTVCLKLDGLYVVIFDKDLDTFLKQHLDPAMAYEGKKIRVFGLIKKYKGHPEMIISHPSQIEVLE